MEGQDGSFLFLGRLPGPGERPAEPQGQLCPTGSAHRAGQERRVLVRFAAGDDFFTQGNARLW